MKFDDKPALKITIGIILMALEIAIFIFLYSLSNLPTLLILNFTLATVVIGCTASIKLFLNAMKELQATPLPSWLNKVSGYSLDFVIVCDSCISLFLKNPVLLPTERKIKSIPQRGAKYTGKGLE